MTSPGPEFARVMAEATKLVQELHERLHDTYPVLQGNLSIPGMLVGHGLGAFVANGMSDDQIVAHVLGIVRHIRQTVGSAREGSPDDDDTVH